MNLGWIRTIPLNLIHFLGDKHGKISTLTIKEKHPKSFVHYWQVHPHTEDAVELLNHLNSISDEQKS